MAIVTIDEAKTRLSKLIARAEAGAEMPAAQAELDQLTLISTDKRSISSERRVSGDVRPQRSSSV